MTNSKKDEVDDMQAAQAHSIALPLPKQEEKRLVQGEINLELFEACEKEMKKQGLKIREIMQFGFQAWLIRVNPKKAMELGILRDE